MTIPIEVTGFKSMKNLIGLIDIICDTYDRADLQPKDGITFCNVAADAIATAMGCKDFTGKNADQIFEFVNTSSQWDEIQMADAQWIVNEGSLVFAVATSEMLGQSHGHICVVRPGLEKNSGKWGQCPAIMNVGAENFLARAKKGPLTGMPCGINEAFVPEPHFFVWKNSL